MDSRDVLVPIRIAPFATSGISTSEEDGSRTVRVKLTCCKCGAQHLQLSGYLCRIPDDSSGRDYVMDPYSVNCSICGHSSVVFDAQFEGLNAVLDGREVGDIVGQPHTVKMGEPYQVCVEVVYDDDIDEYPEPADCFSSIGFSCIDDSGDVLELDGIETA
jgi:hypothetical protein